MLWCDTLLLQSQGVSICSNAHGRTKWHGQAMLFVQYQRHELLAVTSVYSVHVTHFLQLL